MQRSASSGPGEYLCDPTQGAGGAADLPAAQVLDLCRDFEQLPCPRCGTAASRLRRRVRELHDLGDPMLGVPRRLRVLLSQHCCPGCNAYFSADAADLAPPRSRYTHRVSRLAVRLVAEDGLPYRPAAWHLWRDHRVFVPFATIQNWVESAGEKSLVPRRPRGLPGSGARRL